MVGRARRQRQVGWLGAIADEGSNHEGHVYYRDDQFESCALVLQANHPIHRGRDDAEEASALGDVPLCATGRAIADHSRVGWNVQDRTLEARVRSPRRCAAL